jgi:anti-anti-sigma factor
VTTSLPNEAAFGLLEGVEPHVLVVVGELDMATAPALAERLATDATIRVVDLRHVTFVDAQGIRPLLMAARRRSCGEAVELLAPSRAVRRFLEVAGLASIAPHP